MYWQFIFLLAIANSLLAQSFAIVPQNVVENRLNSLPNKTEREPALRKMFEEAGCVGKDLTEEPVKGTDAPNLICRLQGSSGSTVVVGAHFDFFEAGEGVADNWSGASLLVSLYQGLAAANPRHTFRFVAFTGQEAGQLGSSAYVQEHIAGNGKEPTAAMVNLDTLGLGETRAWVTPRDSGLARLLEAASESMNIPASGMNPRPLGATDVQPFRDAHVPAILIHSLTPDTYPILHSALDRAGAIQQDEYYGSYRLILAFLSIFDRTMD